MSVLGDELRAKILAYLPRYPRKQAVVLPALHLVQDAHRCVSFAAIREIAELLDLAPAEVYDAMTFYGFFRGEDKPLGKTRVWVCRSLACALRGSESVLRELCRKLHIHPGDTGLDGKITVEFAECIGVCEGAPAILVNDEARTDVTKDKVEALIAEFRA